MTTLLLVDVQKDFHPGGSLAIPAAGRDAERIAALIHKHGPRIDRIVATMDSHQKLHIAHPVFWIRGSSGSSGSNEKQHPDPFTIISAEDLRNGIWMPRQDLVLLPADGIDPDVFANPPFCNNNNVADGSVAAPPALDLTRYCIEYATRLEEAGRFQICIWPEHCLMGSPGHGMVDVVLEAIHAWSAHTGRTVEWVHKGQHVLTEMYSALAAEVPVTKETAFNDSLQKSLLMKDDDDSSSSGSSRKLIVCGQAMSHCVNYTVRDIVDHWPENRRSDIVLLTDCASAVPGFETAAQGFLNDIQEAGLQLRLSTDEALF
jgi:nicotinamidase/pyrazinamidase